MMYPKTTKTCPPVPQPFKVNHLDRSQPFADLGQIDTAGPLVYCAGRKDWPFFFPEVHPANCSILLLYSGADNLPEAFRHFCQRIGPAGPQTAALHPAVAAVPLHWLAESGKEDYDRPPKRVTKTGYARLAGSRYRKSLTAFTETANVFGKMPVKQGFRFRCPYVLNKGAPGLPNLLRLFLILHPFKTGIHNPENRILCSKMSTSWY